MPEKWSERDDKEENKIALNRGDYYRARSCNSDDHKDCRKEI